MGLLPSHWLLLLFASLALTTTAVYTESQTQLPSSPSAAASHAATSSPKQSGIDPGSLTNGLYRNKTLGFTCKIPAGWVLRTDEMNAPPDNDENQPSASSGKPDDRSQSAATEKRPEPTPSATGRVLLAAFSRPPEAHGQEVNSSIVIAAEPVITYPGLTDAAQYFGPIIEVAQAQGFAMDEDPYEVAIGTRTLVRGDFHKDVGTRVLRQSTLAMLSHGYAVSFTVIAGTEDDVEELIDGLDFQGSSRVGPPRK